MASVFEATSRTPAACATGRTVRVTSSRSVARNSCPGPLPFCHASPSVDARFGRLDRPCAARRLSTSSGSSVCTAKVRSTSGRVLFTSLDWLLYALLTPFVFVIARRWPLAKPHVAQHAALHLVVSLLFCAAWAGAGTLLSAAAPAGVRWTAESPWDPLRELAVHHAAVRRRGLPRWSRHRARHPVFRRGARARVTGPLRSSSRARGSRRCRRSSIRTSCSTRSTRSPCSCATATAAAPRASSSSSATCCAAR